MDGKPTMKSAVMTLLVFVVFTILPAIGQKTVCPWCDKSTETKLVNCLYIFMVTAPELDLPISSIDQLKWKLLADSDSMTGMPYNVKKEKMDDDLGTVMANFIQNYFPNNPPIRDLIAKLAAKCYCSITGYDEDLVTRQIKAKVIDEITKISGSSQRNPYPISNSGKPYADNQQKSLPPRPPVQPPVKPPNSFAPSNSFSHQNQPPMDSNKYGNNPAFHTNKPVENGPFNSPKPASVDSPTGNYAPYDYPESPQVTSFKNPPLANSGSFNLPQSPTMKPYNNPSVVNKDSEPSQNRPSIVNGRQAEPNYSGNQDPSRGSSDSSNQNDNGHQNNKKLPDNATWAPAINSKINPTRVNKDGSSEDRSSNDNEGQVQAEPSGVSSDPSNQNNDEPQSNRNSPTSDVPAAADSSKMSSQDSKSSNSNNSNGSTASPDSDTSEKKTTVSGKSNDEEPCDEKFKTALYETLMNDKRFRSFCAQLPASKTKASIPLKMKSAFEEYGIPKHFTEFSTFWTFESKELNRESKVEDYDELISKVVKIVFSRNNLLKENCEETGKKIADYFLGTLPGDSPTTSTEKPSPNDGNDKSTTEPNSVSQVDLTNPTYHSTTSPSPEINPGKSNFTSSEDTSFHELHSKLSNIFKHNGTSDQNNDDTPFSSMLSNFETQENLHTLLNAAKSCISSDGFDFNKFTPFLSQVAESIQKNHPDWSRDKCEREMYSEAVVALIQALQDNIKSSSGNDQSESTTSRYDSDVTSNDSQSSNSDEAYDYDLSSDDSVYPDYDYYSGNVPPYPQYDTNYGDYPANGKQPYTPDYSYEDYGKPDPQKFPSYDYNVNPPASMNPQQSPGAQPFPASPNNGQQSQNLKPNSGIINPSNGNFRNNQFQPNNDYGLNAGPQDAGPVLPKDNFPASAPVVPSDNSQRQYNSNYNPKSPDYGPVFQKDSTRNSQPSFQPGYNPKFSAPNYYDQPY